MGLRGRVKKARRTAEKLMPERVVIVTDDGEEISFAGDPLTLVVEEWLANVEDRPVEHPLAPHLECGLRLKHPERVADPLWKILDGTEEAP